MKSRKVASRWKVRLLSPTTHKLLMDGQNSNICIMHVLGCGLGQSRSEYWFTQSRIGMWLRFLPIGPGFINPFQWLRINQLLMHNFESFWITFVCCSHFHSDLHPTYCGMLLRTTVCCAARDVTDLHFLSIVWATDGACRNASVKASDFTLRTAMARYIARSEDEAVLFFYRSISLLTAGFRLNSLFWTEERSTPESIPRRWMGEGHIDAPQNSSKSSEIHYIGMSGLFFGVCSSER